MSGPGGDSTFRHGIHPAEHKEATEHLSIERMPFVRQYVLPLGQHGGKAAKGLLARALLVSGDVDATLASFDPAAQGLVGGTGLVLRPGA